MNTGLKCDRPVDNTTHTKESIKILLPIGVGNALVRGGRGVDLPEILHR